MKKLTGGTKFVGVTLDVRTAQLLNEMAARDVRTVSGQVRWLIEMEVNRRMEPTIVTSDNTRQADYAWKAEG